MDKAGWVKLDDVINYLKIKKGYKDVHIKDIQAIVDNNDKKRF
jgi:RNA:NAD 2'-phosphotransferase (TPT1/KptA family)